MKADLTRNSFNPLKHFSRVLMQQGRVQLDADWNEQTGILLHLLRRLAADSLGSAYSPDKGFTPTPLPTAKAVADDFCIAGGSYYVDGILCELESTPVAVLAFDGNNSKRLSIANWTVDGQSFQTGQYLQIYDDSLNPVAGPIVSRIAAADYTNLQLTFDDAVDALQQATNSRVRRLATYRSQPDLPQPPALTSGTAYQLYLDVWERALTFVEDDSIREVALNGPDTAARARVVWQVKALPHQRNCLTQQQLADQLQPPNRGLLRARVQQAAASSDPCTISPDSQYRGVENQLYRVEIHTGGNVSSNPPPSFKVSRENGAVVFPIVKLSAGGGTTTVILANLGRDERFGLAEGDYVEVQDESSVLNNAPGTLLQVQSIDRVNCGVTLSGNSTVGVGQDAGVNLLLRRWDHKAGDAAQGGLSLGKDGAALIPLDLTQPGAAGVWLDLEDGVQVQFDMLMDQNFRSGDYWLIPARVATGNVIWPQERVADPRGKTVSYPAAIPPNGITHHYAPLAIILPGSGASPRFNYCGANFNTVTAQDAPAQAVAANGASAEAAKPAEVVASTTVAKTAKTAAAKKAATVVKSDTTKPA